MDVQAAFRSAIPGTLLGLGAAAVTWALITLTITVPGIRANMARMETEGLAPLLNEGQFMLSVGRDVNKVLDNANERLVAMGYDTTQTASTPIRLPDRAPSHAAIEDAIQEIAIDSAWLDQMAKLSPPRDAALRLSATSAYLQAETALYHHCRRRPNCIVTAAPDIETDQLRAALIRALVVSKRSTKLAAMFTNNRQEAMDRSFLEISSYVDSSVRQTWNSAV